MVKAKKKLTKGIKKAKTNGELHEITALHNCIDKDHSQLDKLYKKSFIKVNSKINKIKQAILKAKKATSKAKVNRKSSPKIYQSVLSKTSSLQTQLKDLKNDQTSLETNYAKYNAKKKALLKLEKTWKGKKAKKSLKSKIKNPRKIIIKETPVEVAQLS